MKRRGSDETEAVLGALCKDRRARLRPNGEGDYVSSGPAGAKGRRFSGGSIRDLLGRGLLASEDGKNGLCITGAGVAWLKRRRSGGLPFREQHHAMAKVRAEPGGQNVLATLEESPVASLARRVGRSGKPWLLPHAATAAERLRRDFEIGGLQPRITANWSASVSDGRRSGDNSGLGDLTDMALAARLRFDKAVGAVGPELSGVLIDICCFLKGLETVERERQWPARSAKLVLRLALERLARHYGLTAEAAGRPGSAGVRHWGADDYRPEVS